MKKGAFAGAFFLHSFNNYFFSGSSLFSVGSLGLASVLMISSCTGASVETGAQLAFIISDNR